ncbi:MAG: MGDG synthase family glycosyltransferase [Candidatus Rokuibacteriota bacterium]
MPRVLILTASYGSGHNEAARCLAAGFERAGARATVVDHFRDLVHPVFARASRSIYYGVLRHSPALWGAAYALADRLPSDSPLTFGMTRLGAGRLLAYIEREAPDLIVSVHATPAVVLSALAAAGGRVPPHTTVVTDFVAHRQWIAPRIDRYCVAAEEVQHEFIAHGIPRERVVVTGVPLRGEFEAPCDGEAARRALGLHSRAPVALAMAGSLGSVGRLPDVTRALLEARRPLQGLVVAGHDRRLHATLAAMTEGTRVRALGYVPDVRRLMAAADLLITKAGGMTLAEALAAGTPMLLYGSIPGQERRNERFAARIGVALVARSRAALATMLERALTDPGLLDELRERGRRARHPDATDRVVATVLGLGARTP